MSVGANIRVGAYLAVRVDGEICCGYQNGMKLYAYPGPAIKKAGPGGTVYLIKHNGYGIVSERVSGPPVGAIT